LSAASATGKAFPIEGSSEPEAGLVAIAIVTPAGRLVCGLRIIGGGRGEDLGKRRRSGVFVTPNFKWAWCSDERVRHESHYRTTSIAVTLVSEAAYVALRTASHPLIIL
jgi:hypothetical protein